MCMIYAFSSKLNYQINSSLRNFFINSYKHPHGWGMAIYTQNKEARIIKGGEAAHKSILLKEMLDKRIAGRLAIAHIRYATMGGVSYNNAHPFYNTINNEDWVFAHNGRIESFNFENMSVSPYGETDSEKSFCYINEQLIINKAFDFKLKVKVLESAIDNLSNNAKLNLVISDGTYLYVHCNLRNSLFKYEKENLVCFSSRPIYDDEELWQCVELNKLLVYKDGQLIYIGKDHGHEYKITPGRAV